MDSVWILTNCNDWEQPLVEEFQKEGLWDKVIINKEDFFNQNSDIEILPQKYYDKIYSYLPQFVDMISRNSPINQNTYAEFNVHDFLNLFNIYIDYYYTQFKQEQITLYITNRAPHVGFDLIAYLVAKAMEIKTVILEQSLFPNRFFIYSEHEDYGTFSTSKHLGDYEKNVIDKKHEKNLFYMKKKKLSFRDSLRKFYTEDKTVRLVSELLHKQNRGQALYRNTLKKEFEKNKNKYVQKVDLREKFIYFALHLQPEKTTSSWGGKYVDQLLAIEHLSQVIPVDVKIYVKENPKQGFFMRGKYFYERIKRLKNVFLVPNNTSTYDLIKNSLFVSTITGTVGWEAISGGKNVLVFGWGVWYKNFSGVFCFNEIFDFNQIINHKIKYEQLELDLNTLISKTGKGVVYTKGGGYTSIVNDFSFDKNILNLSASIKKYLYNV